MTPSEWAAAPIDRTEETLRIDGRVVMSRWETPAIRAMVDALDIRSYHDVLEIGFGMGIAAAMIRDAGPRRHVVAELNDRLADRAIRGGYEVARGDWRTSEMIAARTWDRVLFDAFQIDPGGELPFREFALQGKSLVRPYGRAVSYVAEGSVDETDDRFGVFGMFDDVRCVTVSTTVRSITFAILGVDEYG